MLNDCPDAVALAEPIDTRPHGVRQRASSEIDACIATTLHSLLRDGIVGSQSRDGMVPGKVAEAARAAPGRLRTSSVRPGPIQFEKPLSTDSRLVIEHPALFAAPARELDRRYPLDALVHDPLAILASRPMVDIRINRSDFPISEDEAGVAP